MATDSVASSSSTSAERNAIRSVDMVSRRCASPVRRSPSAWALARPNTCRVGRPVTRSAKWWASRCCTAARFRTLVWVSQPTRTMNSGISGRVSATTTAETQSAVRMATPTTSGTVAASTSWGR